MAAHLEELSDSPKSLSREDVLGLAYEHQIGRHFVGHMRDLRCFELVLWRFVDRIWRIWAAKNTTT